MLKDTRRDIAEAHGIQIFRNPFSYIPSLLLGLTLLWGLTSPGLSTASPSFNTRTESDARTDMAKSFSPHAPTATVLHSLQSCGVEVVGKSAVSFVSTYSSSGQDMHKR